MENSTNFSRRDMLGFAAASSLLALPGCSSLPGLSLTEAIRRLLTVSSQQAFAQLLAPNGFYDSQIARITVPNELGGSTTGNILGVVLRSGFFQRRLQRQVNRAAEKGAELAAPLIADGIRNLSIEDAAALVGGGGHAATDLLKGRMGNSLLEAMLPGIGGGLKLFDDAVVTEALRAATGIDFAGLRDDVTGKTSDAIYRAIGAQEEAIRANPQATNDPLLIAIFGGR